MLFTKEQFEASVRSEIEKIWDKLVEKHNKIKDDSVRDNYLSSLIENAYYNFYLKDPESRGIDEWLNFFRHKITEKVISLPTPRIHSQDKQKQKTQNLFKSLSTADKLSEKEISVVALYGILSFLKIEPRLTQEEVAKKLNLDRSRISQIYSKFKNIFEKCNKPEEGFILFPYYIKDLLSPEKMYELSRHNATCNVCQEIFRTTSENLSFLKEMMNRVELPSIDSTILKFMTSYTTPARSSKNNILYPKNINLFLILFCATCLLIVTGYGVYDFFVEKHQSPKLQGVVEKIGDSEVSENIIENKLIKQPPVRQRKVRVTKDDTFTAIIEQIDISALPQVFPKNIKANLDNKEGGKFFFIFNASDIEDVESIKYEFLLREHLEKNIIIGLETEVKFDSRYFQAILIPGPESLGINNFVSDNLYLSEFHLKYSSGGVSIFEYNLFHLSTCLGEYKLTLRIKYTSGDIATLPFTLRTYSDLCPESDTFLSYAKCLFGRGRDTLALDYLDQYFRNFINIEKKYFRRDGTQNYNLILQATESSIQKLLKEQFCENLSNLKDRINCLLNSNTLSLYTSLLEHKMVINLMLRKKEEVLNLLNEIRTITQFYPSIKNTCSECKYIDVPLKDRYRQLMVKIEGGQF